MTRTSDVRLRVDPVEHEIFRRAAELDGLSMSAWLRRIARQEAAKTCAGTSIVVPWAKEVRNG